MQMVFRVSQSRSVGGTLKEFYNYCEMRYGKFNRPTTLPRRGRPPKIR